MFTRRSKNRQVPKSGFVDQFGSRFVVDEMEDLELLTDLLDLSGDHLNLLFAVASYVQRVPNGKNRLTPVVIERMGRSRRNLH